ncbi:hypothetical protein MKX01_037639 [Papaver californicum]|nr:hypothetical protein MKX01_037639 [Papaver californicum]
MKKGSGCLLISHANKLCGGVWMWRWRFLKSSIPSWVNIKMLFWLKILILPQHVLFSMYLRTGNGKISASGGNGFAGGGGGRVAVNVYSRHNEPEILVHGSLAAMCRCVTDKMLSTSSQISTMPFGGVRQNVVLQKICSPKIRVVEDLYFNKDGY